MRQFDTLTPDEFDDALDKVIEEVENEELRLKKQETMFDVMERDQAYYESLIRKTDGQIREALQTMR